MCWPALLQLFFLVLLLASPGPCRSHKIAVQSSVGKHLSSSTEDLYPRDWGHKAHRNVKLPVIRQPAYLWQLTMHVGGQHERLVVDIDTGSASLIVQRGSYHPGSTAKNLHRETKLAFGEGTDNFSFKAHLYEDFVQLGPLTGRARVQRIIGPHNGALSVSDGLVGLCRSGYSEDDAGFLQSIRNSKNWNGIFTTDFRIDGGWIDFASPVANRDYSGELVWLPLLNEAAFSPDFSFWDVAGQLGDLSFNATIDSGTYGIALPGKAFDQIIAKHPHHLEVVLDQESGASYMLGDCDWTPSSLPFRFVGDNGHIFEVSMGPTAFWLSGPAKDHPGKCYGAIVGEVGVAEDAPWIIGASIFLSSVVVHDVDGKRLGFAHKVDQS